MQITNSQLVFGGIARPQEVKAFFDAGEQYVRDSENVSDIAVLERYFTDIQNLFFKTLSLFLSDLGDATDHTDAAKLRALLDELIKVKALIVSHSVVADRIVSRSKSSKASKPTMSRRLSRNLRRRSK